MKVGAMPTRYPNGCPCEGTCCDDPDVVPPPCTCPPEDECECGWCRECRNCGAFCRCEV